MSRIHQVELSIPEEYQFQMNGIGHVEVEVEVEVAIPVEDDGNESVTTTDPNAERMKELLKKQSENSEDPAGSSDCTWGDHGTSTSEDMEPDLYKAAAEYDDKKQFMDFLVEILDKKKLHIRKIFMSVSLSGNSLLHVAAKYGNFNIMNLIIEHFPSLLNKRNAKGDTAMHIAAKAGQAKAIEQLQIAFTSSRLPNTKHCNLADREVALEDVCLRLKNEDGNTPLHEALINRFPSVAKTLVHADWEVSYFLNNEAKSPLYLAAEAGYVDCLEVMLKEDIFEKVKGKSPVHAAIIARRKDVLVTLLSKEPNFIHSIDEEGGNSLHCAASMGYLEEVHDLISRYNHNALKRDKNGQLPIHLASIKGHVDVIKELLQLYHDPHELLDKDGQNILHIAAKSGKYNVVRYILKTPKLTKLINEKDKDGNTPLHLASMHWYPKIVSALTWDKRVDLKLINSRGLTALDAADYYMEEIISFPQRLTWSALKAAGAMRASSGKILNAGKQACEQKKPPETDKYKDRVNTLLLVATLIATITFAAGFTLPGGYNNSNPDQGTATMIRHSSFQMFVLCDTVAMYSSLVVAVTLIWAQLGDLGLVVTALKVAVPILGVALTMMALAFMAGVYLVVSKLHWLAYAVLVMGSVFLAAVGCLFFPLCFPVTSTYPIMRYITFYLICLASFITGTSL